MAEIRHISKGSTLFKEGDTPDNMYVVKTGGFDIFKLINGQSIKVSEAGENQLIGEMALFDLQPRSATLIANQDSSVVVLSYVNLLDQMDKLPNWVKIVMKTLSENLRRTTEQLSILNSKNK